MIVEISYEKYKEFCKLLPCKDVFYYLSNLFVKFPYDDTIYGVKYDCKSNPEDIYNGLVETNNLEVQKLSEFLKGLPITESGTFVQSTVYKDKSYLVVL